MEELEIRLGQRALPSVHGDQTTATAYAGLGTRHVLVLADGSAGEVGSRLAAQTAAASALARIRGSVLPDLGSTLLEAFGEAHQATRRALMGTGLEGKAGVSLIAVVVDPGGFVSARVGGGRVYLLRGDRLDAVYSAAGPETVGIGEVEPEIILTETAFGIGDRILVLNEAAARPLAADLERLGRGGEAQLSASRLADAARRRGQLDPVSVQIVDIAGDSPRSGPHPALSRLARTPGDTFGLEGRRLGRRHEVSGSGLPRRQGGGFAIVAGLGLVLGALVALTIHDRGAPMPAVEAPRPGVLVDAAEPDTVGADTGDTALAPESDVAPTVLPEVAALLAGDSPRAIARGIKNYVTKNFPADGDAVFSRLEDGIIARGADGQVIEALLELMREPELKRTAKWVQELLPRLYARSGDATP